MESLPIEDIEYKIHLATCPKQKGLADESKIAEANEFAKNVKNTPEGLSICLSNFSSFSRDALIFTLQILTYWLDHRFDEIPPDVVAAIFEFLNTTALEKLPLAGPEGAQIFAKAQATFTIKTYLEILPETIQSFFDYDKSKAKKTPSLNYALHLFRQLTTPSPNTFDLHHTIIQKMQEDGSLEGITKAIQKEMLRDDIAIQILIYYSRFMDIQFLDQEFFEHLNSCLEFEKSDVNVPLVYLSILQRQDDKKSFIETLKLNDLIAQFCENPNYKKIVISNFGALISYCGFSFPDEKIYYEFAIRVGSVVSVKATLSVLNYINSATVRHLDYIENTLNFVLNRIRLHYEKRFQPPEEGPHPQKKIDLDRDNEFIESLVQVSTNCFVLNQELSEQILQAFLSSTQNVLENIPSAISLFSVILSVFQSKIVIAQIDDFIPVFNQLIANALNSPVFDDAFSTLYSFALNALLIFDERYPTPDVFKAQDIFRSIIQYTINPNLYLWKFQKLLVQCCIKYGLNNNVNENDLTLFADSPSPETGKILGALVNCVPVENRPQVVQQTVDKTQELLKSSPNENNILFSLSIFSTMKCPPEDPFLTNVLSFIQEMLNNDEIQNNDHYLSRTIKAISSLNLAGTQTIIDIYPNIAEIESLTILAKLALSIRKIANLKKSEIKENLTNSDPGLHVALDNNWILKFSSYLVEKLQEFSSSISFYEKEELGNYFSFINAVVMFFSYELQNVQPQDIITIANILDDGICMFYDAPEMNNAFLVFASALTAITNQEIVDILTNYVRISLNFIYTEKLVLFSLKWKHVLLNLLKFYCAANGSLQQAFQQTLAEEAQSMGATSQSIQNFLSVFDGADPNSLNPALQFAYNFFSDFFANRIYV